MHGLWLDSRLHDLGRGAAVNYGGAVTPAACCTANRNGRRCGIARHVKHSKGRHDDVASGINHEMHEGSSARRGVRSESWTSARSQEPCRVVYLELEVRGDVRTEKRSAASA
jgi:hypothetical protein